MTETLKAWQCIGCGKLEAPQNCIGVCQDRRVELVYAFEYEAIAAELARACAERDALAALARRIAALEADDASALAALRIAAREALERRQPAPDAAPPEHADEPLRDRRGAASTVASSDSVADAETAAGNAAGSGEGASAIEAGDKPRVRKPATLYVR